MSDDQHDEHRDDTDAADDSQRPDNSTDDNDSGSSSTLDRRSFLKASAVAAGAGAAAAGCPGLFEDDDEPDPEVDEVDYQVRPGELDEYYAFVSGGQAGDVRVYGIPSGRQIMRIPVFNYEPARGWGFDDESREMLEIDGGDFTWGDTHHPRLSQTDNDYDGRWCFINDKANGRMARIDLKYFVTDAILDIPNHQGTHGACAVMPDTTYVIGVGELEVPIPNDGRHLDDPESYQTTLTAIDPETMMIEWEVLLDVNLDNMDSGKRGEWFFASSYNTENGVDEAGMTRADQDYTIAFNIPAIEAAVEAGEYDEINDIPVVDGTEDSPLNEGDNPVTRYIPTPKNPHGVSVTPDGRYAIVSGKLDPTATVIDIEALNEVEDPSDAIAAQPRLGMGPLHTAYDGRGHAYTTMFVDSQVVKWDIDAAVEAHPEDGEEDSPAVVEKIDVHYNPGHIIASESYTADPAGDWLLSLNKLSKDRFMNVGPVFPDNDQLIYIGDDEAGMQLVRDIPAYPEPHDASICHRDKLNPEQVYDPDDLELEHTGADESSIERVDDDRVEVRMYSIRNHFGHSDITVQEGDTVELQVTNVETTTDIVHGLAIPDYDVHLKIAPHETVKATFTADRPGVYWMYCTYFCSALHLEMRSRLLVEPAEPVEET